MTFPVATVDSKPYCGACGWNTYSVTSLHVDIHQDLICDSCGSDLLAFGWTVGHVPPTVFTVQGDTPLALQATFAWIVQPLADTTDLQWRVNVDPWNLESAATTPHVETGPFTSGDKIEGQVRSVNGGTPGPWSVSVTDGIA
jgi:hypothetical protein